MTGKSLTVAYLSLTNVFSDKRDSDGVSKKVIAQARAMERNGYDTYIFGYGDQGIVFGRADKTQVSALGADARTRRWDLFKYVAKTCTQKNIDILYIRYPYCDPGFLSMLRSVKKSGVEVVIEIPTYPIERVSRSHGVKLAALSRVDGFFGWFMKDYVKEIRVIGENCSQVYGIPAKNIINAIDAKGIPSANKPGDDTFHLIGVSTCKNWHGYDRVIEGLANYYTTNHCPENVILTLIGDGNMREEWEKAAKRLDVVGKVCFAGALNSLEIDKVFACASIALGSLGLHRIGLNRVSTLKCKEYCARGVPFLCSNIELGLPADFPYMIKVAPDDSPIDIALIISEYKAIIQEHQDYACEMKDFARQYLQWERYMRFE